MKSIISVKDTTTSKGTRIRPFSTPYQHVDETEPHATPFTSSFFLRFFHDEVMTQDLRYYNDPTDCQSKIRWSILLAVVVL